MTIDECMSHLRNICINTDNMEAYDRVKSLHKETNDNKLAQQKMCIILEIIEHIKLHSTFTKEEISLILQKEGINSFQYQHEINGSYILYMCKKNSKIFNVKVLYPTHQYVIGNSPWQIMPTKVNDKWYKEARKFMKDFNTKYKYKRVTISEELYQKL